MPDTFKFIFVVAVVAGAIYGSAWALAHFPPEQAEIIKTLPNDNLRQK